MKRIYRGKKVMARSTQLTVRQVFGFGSADVRERMGRIAGAAQAWLDVAIAECHSGMSGKVAKAFELCFKTAPTPEAVNTVRSVLSTTASSIRKAHAVKVRDDDDAFGYVRLSFGGRRHLTNGVVFYDNDGDEITGLGEIHVSKGVIRDNPTLAAVTYIHEATHRFVNTTDFGNKGYFKDDGSDFIQAGLPWRDALRNADSYAFFAYKVVQASFQSVIIS